MRGQRASGTSPWRSILADCRFSLRGSSTEPLLHLNVESHADEALVSQRVAEIERLIQE